MNPLDEYMKLRKEGSFWGGVGSAFSGPNRASMGTDLTRKALAGGALALGGAVIGAGASVVAKIRESIAHKNDFRQMMTIDPELKAIQAERPQFFNQAYNSLRRINPAFGEDPIIAGSYMRKMMANPDAAGLTLATTVKPPMIPEGGLGIDAEVGDRGVDFKYKM